MLKRKQNSIDYQRFTNHQCFFFKYGTAFSKPHCQCEIGYTERDKQYIIFVKDNGIGIADKYKEEIFQVFTQGGHDRKKYDGTGIGLATCRKIVKNLKGKIWVESKVGKGSIFYKNSKFQIPRFSFLFFGIWNLVLGIYSILSFKRHYIIS